MPVEIELPLRAVSQAEFGMVAYEVMGHAFKVHTGLGRIFDESIYRRTLKRILAPRAADEVRILLTHGGFEKPYFIDLAVDSGCPFELKVVSQLNDRHRRQLIQYLMLADLHHGKLINFGGEEVEHEFINCHETTEHRRNFQVDSTSWSTETAEARDFEGIVLDLLRDWGTGLDRGLYEEAITFFLGGPEAVRRPVETLWCDAVVATQNANLVAANTAFEITCLRRDAESYERHLRRFFVNTSLDRLFWVNIVSGTVTFTVLQKSIAPHFLGQKHD